MIKILNWIVTFLRNTNPVISTIWAAGTLLVTLGKLFSTMWTALLQKIDVMALSGLSSSADFSPLGLIDYIFPLHELCTCITLYAALKLVCVAIRIVKSFVPSVA